MTVNSLESSIAEVKILSLNKTLRFKLFIILTGYRCLADGIRKSAKRMINPTNNLTKTMDCTASHEISTKRAKNIANYS